METINLVPIKNPGISFTKNTYEILSNIVKCFEGKSINGIPYQEFQHEFVKDDPTGDSKIRMLFPLLRKGGCIYPDLNGNVVFNNGCFLTQLGLVFFKVSGLYYQLESNIEEIKQSNQYKLIQNKVNLIYSNIALQVYKNLCESEDVYKYLLKFINKFKTVTKDEIQILLYVLEKKSSHSGEVVSCEYDEKEIDKLIKLYRNNQLDFHSKTKNHASGYFLAILRTLLVVEEFENSFSLSTKSKAFFNLGE